VSHDYRPSTDTGRANPVYTDDPVSNAMLDFMDDRADAWMQETHIVAATHGMCATFDGYVPRELLAKFRRALEAQFHLCFVEGGLRAWEEIAAQQKALGHPLPPFPASENAA
jgi:hypothetical protein